MARFGPIFGHIRPIFGHIWSGLQVGSGGGPECEPSALYLLEYINILDIDPLSNYWKHICGILLQILRLHAEMSDM